MNGVDPRDLIETFGTIGLLVIVFAESGLFFGFFLPGDGLLVTAGLFASRGALNFPVVVVGCFLAAVAGDQVGYAFGVRVGPAVFRRPDSRLFKQENIEKARVYFERHGAKTIVLARFFPVVRTFAPILAGVGNVRYRVFVIYNMLGALCWGVGLTTLGFVLGESVPDIDRYLIPLALLIGCSSTLTVVLGARRNRSKQAPETLNGDSNVGGSRRRSATTRGSSLRR